MESHFEEGEGHGEDHPDVDHLHIRCRWQSARYTDEAERMFNYLIKTLWTDYSQSGQDEKDGEVDHDDHVDVFLFVDIADVADGEEDDGRDEDGEDVADQRSAEADVHLHALVVADRSSTHDAALHDVLREIGGTRVGQVLWIEVDEVSKLVDNLELHGAGLGVEGVPHHVELADPEDCEFLVQEMIVLFS